MLEYKIISLEIKNKLEGLAYWIADNSYIIERFGNDEPELQRVRDTISLLFDELDALKVPFWVQNTVIAYAENWRQYKELYMFEYLKNKNIFCEV